MSDRPFQQNGGPESNDERTKLAQFSEEHGVWTLDCQAFSAELVSRQGWPYRELRTGNRELGTENCFRTSTIDKHYAVRHYGWTFCVPFRRDRWPGLEV
jgi:hypothetical protein